MSFRQLFSCCFSYCFPLSCAFPYWLLFSLFVFWSFLPHSSPSSSCDILLFLRLVGWFSGSLRHWHHRCTITYRAYRACDPHPHLWSCLQQLIPGQPATEKLVWIHVCQGSTIRLCDQAISSRHVPRETGRGNACCMNFRSYPHFVWIQPFSQLQIQSCGAGRCSSQSPKSRARRATPTRQICFALTELRCNVLNTQEKNKGNSPAPSCRDIQRLLGNTERVLPLDKDISDANWEPFSR